MKDTYQNEFQKEKKMLSLLFTICMIWFVGKFFCFWVKSILGNYETTLHSYFLPGDIDWHGCRWTDVHCFSIIDCRWHYSFGDVTFIMNQEEKTNGI